jgi:two-component system chemotaxis response regulator CheB
VDDSAVARQAVSRAIAQAPGLQVAGIAPDGEVALRRVAELQPDVVVLDLEMPVMNGITFLRQLRSTNPSLPVVVFSTMTSTGASATLEAMSAGATAYALKPSALRGSGTGDVETELLPVLRAVLGAATPRSSPPVQQSAPNSVCAVVIAVSTGGPTALQTLLPNLPADLPVPVLVVQHMPAVFTALLARRLNQRCSLEVVEATEGQPISAGTIYIAPGGQHLCVAGTSAAPRVRLTEDPPVNSCRPAADILFETAARVFAGPVLGVVLTGMGVDGRRGASAVTSAGGAIIAQDPASAVVGSMPAAVIEAGLAYTVLPVDDIAGEVARLSKAGR